MRAPTDKPLIVGVTGGIGSGKSAVTDILAAHGIDIVDADVIARLVVAPGTSALRQIVQHFGSAILTSDGSLDRAALRTKIFAAPAQRQWLEALLHPLIRQEIEAQLARSRSPYRVLSSPLLLETGQDALVDKLVLVDTSEALQITRTMQRDKIGEDAVRAIMKAQRSRTERQQHADYIIMNDGNLQDLQSAALKLHKELLAQTHNTQEQYERCNE